LSQQYALPSYIDKGVVMDERPILNKKISLKDFKDYYWLKSELMIFCKEISISSSGGKIELENRILEYLETGQVTSKRKTINKLPKATHPITEETMIGIEHRTYKEKKEFLKSIIGNQFHFTIHLLDYFKEYTGIKTYRDLIEEYYREQKLKRDPDYVKEIAPQFEYNIYIRDFLNDNPDKSKRDAIEYWKNKKSMRGNNKYVRSDLKNII